MCSRLDVSCAWLIISPALKRRLSVAVAVAVADTAAMQQLLVNHHQFGRRRNVRLKRQCQKVGTHFASALKLILCRLSN
ncbi:hypothetical protein T11_12394 [Trichinella zimbabwensis]|uniref:Uncharacterized protein n=1 Tax=Trichinella zimbabwensis TaxID=268475 RepID=A0A0V1GZA5_9BILA|nr:hypothetical protein T11_12394 [Trichinella zimbabwensis]